MNDYCVIFKVRLNFHGCSVENTGRQVINDVDLKGRHLAKRRQNKPDC